MKTSIEITNRTGKRVEKKIVERIMRETLKLSKSKISGFSVSVVFVGKKEIGKINRVYRKKKKPTDVLSFIYSSLYNKGGKALEGELVLCPEIIAANAKKNKVTFQKELAFVLSHGTLHLLGMKHGKRMYEIQDNISMNY